MLRNKGEVNANKIMSFCEDMLACLENDEEECETNQRHIRTKELFRGHVVNDSIEINPNMKKHRHLNTILAKEYIYFYNRC